MRRTHYNAPMNEKVPRQGLGFAALAQLELCYSFGVERSLSNSPTFWA
jgi:hypothetical protein